jgi:hypothetical protein
MVGAKRARPVRDLLKAKGFVAFHYQSPVLLVFIIQEELVQTSGLPRRGRVPRPTAEALLLLRRVHAALP